MLILSTLALVVSAGAWALGVHKTRVAKRAAGRTWQQELRDQLGAAVAPLPAQFDAVAGRRRVAHDAGGSPASFEGSRDELVGIGSVYTAKAVDTVV